MSASFIFAKWLGFADLILWLLVGIERLFGVFSGATLLVGDWGAMLLAVSMIFAGACLLEYARVEFQREATDSQQQPAKQTQPQAKRATYSSDVVAFDRSALD